MAEVKNIIRWVSEARADKDLGPAMTHYLIKDGMIRASNGRITAAHPWPYPGDFLVSGIEFEKILARMERDEPKLEVKDTDRIVIRCGRFHGTVYTLPVENWAYPGTEDANWLPLPDNLINVLQTLRAFISDNPAQAWAGCVALEHGNAYATNNIAVAGLACPVGDIQALLPSFSIDFIMKRLDNLESWAWTSNYVAFRWSTGAWMRSQLVMGQFPEKAATLVREAYDSQPTQEITDEFRAAFDDIAALAEDTVKIYGDKIESRFKKSVIEGVVKCEVPEGKECSIWGASYLIPVIAQASHWSPSIWPKPAPFRGPHCAGFVVGRRE